MPSIGFKEWAVVCEALGAGGQSVIIRKGGIVEGREGFQFRHREFFLFPTFFHEQLTRTRLVNAALPEPPTPCSLTNRSSLRSSKDRERRHQSTVPGELPSPAERCDRWIEQSPAQCQNITAQPSLFLASRHQWELAIRRTFSLRGKKRLSPIHFCHRARSDAIHRCQA